MAPSTEWVQLTDFTDSATQPALSPDGRMLAFLRAPGTFITSGQIYIKMLPNGDPVQLTRDNTVKMSPMFSPDGSQLAYTVSPGWDSWVVPVLGGQPKLLLPNASGLTWVDDRHVLLSENKRGRHLAVVTATESRAEARDVYVPPRKTEWPIGPISRPTTVGFCWWKCPAWAAGSRADWSLLMAARQAEPWARSVQSAVQPPGRPTDSGCTSARCNSDADSLVLKPNSIGVNLAVVRIRC